MASSKVGVVVETVKIVSDLTSRVTTLFHFCRLWLCCLHFNGLPVSQTVFSLSIKTHTHATFSRKLQQVKCGANYSGVKLHSSPHTWCFCETSFGLDLPSRPLAFLVWRFAHLVGTLSALALLRTLITLSYCWRRSSPLFIVLVSHSEDHVPSLAFDPFLSRDHSHLPYLVIFSFLFFHCFASLVAFGLPLLLLLVPSLSCPNAFPPSCPSSFPLSPMACSMRTLLPYSSLLACCFRFPLLFLHSSSFRLLHRQQQQNCFRQPSAFSSASAVATLETNTGFRCAFPIRGSLALGCPSSAGSRVGRTRACPCFGVLVR